MAGVPEPLTAARAAVEQCCHLLLTPTPEVLDRCSVALSTAIGELAGSRDLMAPLKGDPGALAAVRQIQAKVFLTSHLLENAATYHARWNRILASMLEGYTSCGQTPSVARPGRLAVEG